MSPNINSFVGDLVEMAKAFEELPGALAKIESLTHENSAYLDMVQSREQTILALKAEIETHLATIRKVEAERDDAEIRFLELDEKASKALRFLGQVQGMAVQAEVALSPPKPEPEPTPIPAFIEPRAEQGQGEVDPTPNASAHSDAPIDAASVESSTGTGQSDSLPTASSIDTASPSVPSTAENTADAEAATNPSPYSGKRYWYQPSYISRATWLSGGGTEEDYNWRPESRPSYPA